MSWFQALLMGKPVPPPEPPSVSMAFYTEAGTANGRVGTRQLTLEPASGGVDRAMSWSGVFDAHNVGTQNNRLFLNGDVASAVHQYSFNIVNQDDATGLAGKINFALFNTGMTAFIAVRSSQRILRSRWYHYVVTYDGSAVATGLKLYLQSVDDATAQKIMSGSYTTAGTSLSWRYQTGSVNSAGGIGLGGISFRGRQRGHAVWNRVLTPSEVVDLYDMQLGFDPLVGPGDITTLPWYAAAIVSFWPLAADANSATNAVFNFGSLSAITFGMYPLGPDYNFISIFDGVIPNARYMAFGSMYKNGLNQFVCYTRSGTDHVTAGKGVNLVLTSTGIFSVSAPVDVLTDALDLRNFQAGVTDGSDITMFSATWSGGAVQDVFWVKSTDGLVGLTFGAKNSVLGILPGGAKGLTYGKLTQAYVAGEYVQPWYSGNVGGVYRIGLLRRSAAGVWSYVPVYTGTTAYVEACIVAVGNNSYFMIMRLLAGNDLHITISQDDAATWSAPAAMGIGVGECMADACLMPSGNLNLIFCDRGNGLCSVSLGNLPADIIVDPTDWNTPSNVFQRYAFAGGIGGILGYPSIVPDGFAVAGCVSAERSANIADIYFFYGDVEFS